jgi:hypothetical protein
LATLSPGFFSEIAKLLHMASFLNTAALCYMYVHHVPITKLHSSDHVTNHHLPIITVKSQMNYLGFDGDDCDGMGRLASQCTHT